MASNSNDNTRSNSPMHLGITGQFSPEDIQELLGVMGDGSDHQPAEGSEVASQGGDGHCPSGSSLYGEGAPAPAADSTQPAVANQTVSVSVASAAIAPAVAACGQPSAPIGEEAKAQARSERKRSREKQRRSDVNKQFADLTQLLQKIDAEDISEEDVKNGTTCNRVTFNPSNRVDLIARTIVLLERLHEANKRRKADISSLQQQLDEAKKAGEDTAAKLKEAMLAPPGQPMNKQFMMMVPMMMSSDGTGATPAMPMMNPFMQQAAMPFMQMPAPAMAPAVSTAAQPGAMPTAQAPAPGQAQTPAPSAVATPATSAPVAAAPAMMAPTQPAPAAHPLAAPQQPQQPTPPPAAAAFPYMMPHMMGGGGFMMPAGHAMPGQPMTMVPQPMPTVGVPPRPTSEHASGAQEQKDSSPGLSGGSNLAHCA